MNELPPCPQCQCEYTPRTSKCEFATKINDGIDMMVIEKNSRHSSTIPNFLQISIISSTHLAEVENSHFEVRGVYTYEDGQMCICPECFHEWSIQITAESDASEHATKTYKDANGNVLHDGDTVTVIKELKIKGSSQSVKIGTKVKNIRLVEGDHDIDCKIDGFGPMKLKSEFVKKC